MIALPEPSQAGAGADAGGTICTGVGWGAGAGGAVVGGGGGAVVVVVVVVLVVRLLVASWPVASRDVESSRPSNTKAEAETTAIAATSNPPTSQRFRISRPTSCGS